VALFGDTVYKPSKLGQTDLGFGLWSAFISRSVFAGWKVSTCTDGGLYMYHLG